MQLSLVTLFVYIFLYIKTSSSQQTSNIEELLNWCIDSKYHKTRPGPEGSLFGQCTPWKSRSCCAENTTKSMHTDSLYNFNYDHCAEKRIKMSPSCRRHFMQDFCFYECSPNVGPWTVKEQRSWRRERYYKVPLCASDCIAWFEDCKDDYTCTDNWGRNFEWIRAKSSSCSSEHGGECKTNFCPSGSTCQTFLEIYKDPKTFCERVWDHSWEYTDDDQPCMRIWFNGSVGNPNDNVARWKAAAISGSTTVGLSRSIPFVVVFIFKYLLNI